jgi:acetolactate synthase regulatory subunit
MKQARTVTVRLEEELLTLGRTCGVLRRHNLPIRDFAVVSNGDPRTWKLSCVIEAEDAALKGLVLQINNVIGVHETTVTPSFFSEAT